MISQSVEVVTFAEGITEGQAVFMAFMLFIAWFFFADLFANFCKRFSYHHGFFYGGLLYMFLTALAGFFIAGNMP